MIFSEFNHQSGFLDSKFEGEVVLKEIIVYINETKNNKTLPRVLKILTDSTKAEFCIASTDLGKIVEANNQSLEQYDYIIDAIVLARPKETALSILYMEMAKNKKYYFRVFSTQRAAKEWLSIIDLNILESTQINWNEAVFNPSYRMLFSLSFRKNTELKHLSLKCVTGMAQA